MAKQTFMIRTLSSFLDEDLELWLKRKYVKEELTLKELSIQLAQRTRVSVDPTTLYRWMKNMKIPIRTRWFRRK